jgi:hypothetical protein
MRITFRKVCKGIFILIVLYIVIMIGIGVFGYVVKSQKARNGLYSAETNDHFGFNTKGRWYFHVQLS